MASFLTPARAAEPWMLVEKTTFDYATSVNRAQGLTTDGSSLYFSGEGMLEITDMDYNSILLDTDAIDASLANVSSLSYKGLNHIGDIYYSDGLLYIPLDSSDADPVTGEKYNTPVIAIYNASDLSYTGSAYALDTPDGTSDIASWVVVDSAAGVGYTMAYHDATRIIVYNLSDWSFKGYIDLSATIDNAQGAVIIGNRMYFSTDSDGKNVYRANLTTGEVETLFNLEVDGTQEVEGISAVMTDDGWSLYVQNLEYSVMGEVLYRYLRPYGNALSGEIHPGMMGALMMDSTIARDAAIDRLQSAFDGLGAKPVPTVAYDAKGIHATAADDAGPVFWGKAVGATGKAGEKGYAAAMDHTTAGMMIGADVPIGPWRIGALAGQTHSNFNVSRRSSKASSETRYWDCMVGRNGAD